MTRGGGTRRVAAAVVGVMLAAVLSLLVQDTAHACSCVSPDAAAEVARAEVIFVGTPTQRDEPVSDDGSVRSDTPVTWTFDVTSVHRGTATARTAVDSALEDASCGIKFGLGREYLVFARTVDGKLTADLCSGTVAVVQAGAERLTSIGPGSPPAPNPPPVAAVEEPGSSTWLIAAGIVLVLVVGAAVVVLRVRRPDQRLD